MCTPSCFACMQECQTGVTFDNSFLWTGAKIDSNTLRSTAEMAHCYLKVHKSFPNKHRLLIWQHLLNVPRNAPAFQVVTAPL